MARSRSVNDVLGNLHLLVGVLSIVGFLVSGQYMDRVHNHLVGMEDLPRMIFRSTHLYILFTGIANLALGFHRAPYDFKPARLVQTIASVILLAVPVVFGFAFMTEPFLTEFARPYTRPATYMAFGSGILLLTAHVLNRWSADY